jgi:glucose-6-phosphate isomerase
VAHKQKLSYLRSLDEWRELHLHFNTIKNTRIDSLYRDDKEREARYTQRLGALTINYANNCFNEETLYLLRRLAQRLEIEKSIQNLFSCEKVNHTEQRAALHSALRSPELFSGHYYTNSMQHEIEQCYQRMSAIVKRVRAGDFWGHTGKPIQAIVNIGIGGSDLGPKFVVDALAPYVQDNLHFDFVSNLDPWQITTALKNLDKERTVFIICSKTFTTLETLTNAKVAFEWLGGREVIERQCIAVTANIEEAKRFGIASENILPMWDWVGGRFSLWSAIGLSIAMAIGMEGFSELLCGASEVDVHVYRSPLEDNIPLTLALLDIWHANFWNYPTRAIIPYTEHLRYFIDYCQQLIMESNGKSVDRDGAFVDYATSPIIWGGIGSNSQHAFHQLLMQGTHIVPIDFVIFGQCAVRDKQHQHQLLQAQLKAQSDALLKGNNQADINNSKLVVGDNPHNIILQDSLNAKNIGNLIALWEYRTILSALIWRINPFDQFGVELGKNNFKQHYSWY